MTDQAPTPPLEPTGSANPTTPEAADPTGTEPTSSPEPIETAAPEPAKPGEPTPATGGPAELAEAEGPGEPAGPAESAELAKSGQPEGAGESAGLAEPAESDDLVESEESGQLAGSGESAGLGEAAGSGELAESAESGPFAEVGEPAELVESGEPAEAAESGEPAEAAESSESEEVAESAGPGDSVESAELAEASGSGEPAEPAGSVVSGADGGVADAAPEEDAEEAAELGDDEFECALEALLLVVDSPVEEEALASALDSTPIRVAERLRVLANRYADLDRGIDLRRAGGGWRFYTRDRYAPYVEKLLLDGQRAKLTRAALETLAVIAYRQPVTRARVAAVRGVNCDGVIRTLLTRGLVEETGTDTETGGFLYRTTELFLERLGLSSLDDLPPIAPLLPEVDAIDEL